MKNGKVFIVLLLCSTAFCFSSGIIEPLSENDKVIYSMEAYNGELLRKTPPATVEKRKFSPVEYLYGVWVDDNNFRVSATGAPDTGTVSRQDQRISALGSARKAAEEMIIKLVSQVAFDLADARGGAVNYPVIGMYIRKNWTFCMKKDGTVVKERYDAGNNCTIVYEIRRRPGNCFGKYLFLESPSLKGIVYMKNL